MDKIPKPLIVIVVVVALAILAFSASRSLRAGSTGVPAPANPPNQAMAMQHIREKALQRRPGGGMGMQGGPAGAAPGTVTPPP